VQAIGNVVRNHKLGLVFETRVSKGKLLICAIDLLGLQDKPEARQFLSSLPDYAGSKDFDPKAGLDVDLSKRMFSAD
jgi:hypothetical protein